MAPAYEEVSLSTIASRGGTKAGRCTNKGGEASVATGLEHQDGKGRGENGMRKNKQIHDEMVERKISCEPAQTTLAGGDEHYDNAQPVQQSDPRGSNPGEYKTLIAESHLSRPLERVAPLPVTQSTARRDPIAPHPGKRRSADSAPQTTGVGPQCPEVKDFSSNPSPSKRREASLSCASFSPAPPTALGGGGDSGTSPILKSSVRQEQSQDAAANCVLGSELFANAASRSVKVVAIRHADHSKQSLISLDRNVDSSGFNGILKQQDIRYVSSEETAATATMVTHLPKETTSTPADTTAPRESTQITPGTHDIDRGPGGFMRMDTAEASALQVQDTREVTKVEESQEDEAMSGEDGRRVACPILIKMKVRNADNLFSTSGKIIHTQG